MTKTRILKLSSILDNAQKWSHINYQREHKIAKPFKRQFGSIYPL